MMKTEQLTLTQEWDKTFPMSDKVDHSKVTFINHFGITLAADMYVPKNAVTASIAAAAEHKKNAAGLIIRYKSPCTPPHPASSPWSSHSIQNASFIPRSFTVIPF